MTAQGEQYNVDMPPGLQQLLRHLGPDLLQIHRVQPTGDLAFSTRDTQKLVDALLDTIRDSDSDEVLSVHAALLLGSGQELAPLGYVLPRLAPLLSSEDKYSRYWAALALEFAAPAPGNEDMVRDPSDPSESLPRIAERYPEVSDVAEFVKQDYLQQNAREPESHRPRPA